MAEKDVIELKRAPGTCCPEPGCDNWSCLGCEYLGSCWENCQKLDYCPRPRTCPSCGADCTKCDRWQRPIVRGNFSKMTEGQALYQLGVRAVVEDGKAGLRMPIPDKPGQSIFIQASDEKPEVVVASHRKEDRLKGARKTRCADCRRKVWISPSTQVMLRRFPGTPVICILCFVKRAEEEEKKKKEA